LHQSYEELSHKNSVHPVELLALWGKVEGLIFNVWQRPFEGVASELQARWKRILNFREGQHQVGYKSEDLRAAVEESFRAPYPGWRLARYNSPDVMISAPSVDAIRSGDFQFVLGEMHAATNTVRYSFAVSQHPEPQELFHAIATDLPSVEVFPVPPKHWPRNTNRTAIGLAPPQTLYLEVAEDPIANGPRSKVLQIAGLQVFHSGKNLIVRTRDGSLQFDLIDFVGEVLSNAAIDMVKIIPAARHVPRVTVDRLVVAREAWSLLAEEITFAAEEHEHMRYLGARQWMESHGMPRFVFVKAPIEVKPFYLDFDSPIYVEIFAKIVRRMAASHRAAETITVSEMLPAPDHLWLPDAEGHTYTSELRMVVRDLAATKNHIV
jgi:hypothetical protein